MAEGRKGEIQSTGSTYSECCNATRGEAVPCPEASTQKDCGLDGKGRYEQS